MANACTHGWCISLRHDVFPSVSWQVYTHTRTRTNTRTHAGTTHTQCVLHWAAVWTAACVAECVAVCYSVYCSVCCSMCCTHINLASWQQQFQAQCLRIAECFAVYCSVLQCVPVKAEHALPLPYGMGSCTPNVCTFHYVLQSVAARYTVLRWVLQFRLQCVAQRVAVSSANKVPFSCGASRRRPNILLWNTIFLRMSREAFVIGGLPHMRACEIKIVADLQIYRVCDNVNYAYFYTYMNM